MNNNKKKKKKKEGIKHEQSEISCRNIWKKKNIIL